MPVFQHLARDFHASFLDYWLEIPISVRLNCDHVNIGDDKIFENNHSLLYFNIVPNSGGLNILRLR